VTGLQRWIGMHVKWLVPFLLAVATAVKPLVLGGDYSAGRVLFAVSLVLGAFVTYVAPNVESGIGQYAKAFVVVSLAGVGAAQDVLPGGISRADVWTIGTAVAAAAGTLLLRTSQVPAVIASGEAQMGDQQLGNPSTVPPMATTDSHTEGH
jgi:hypothetical protein